MQRAYVGLGSNLGASLNILHSALAQLRAEASIEQVRLSCFYRSKPIGPQNQPDYYNAAVELMTDLSPEALLETLFAIERTHGRVRDPAQRWGARTLDLDLLLFANVVQHSSTLTLPHPQLCARAFVLRPLLDLNPTLALPDGRRVADCLALIAGQELSVVVDAQEQP